MDFVKIDSNFNDTDKLRTIKEEDFPGLDNIKVETYITLQENGEAHAYGAYDNGQVIGYIVYMNRDEDVYFINLAVDTNSRWKGYGSKILKTIMDYFKNKKPQAYFSLIVEKPFENAKNLAQLKSRIKLYERLSFYMTDFDVDNNNDTYVIMSTEKI